MNRHRGIARRAGDMKAEAVALLFLAFLASSRVVFAQQNVRIEGRLIDGVGQAVAGLEVSAIDPASGAGAASTQSQNDGSFKLLVPPGVYVVDRTLIHA